MKINWKKVLLWAGIIVVGGFLLIQLVPYGRSRTNPPVQTQVAWASPEAEAAARAACYDCHSNETSWPWYSYIAPVSWLVAHDVEEGREFVNFSEGPYYREADELAEVVQSGYMPPSYYVLMHPDAKLSPADKQALIDALRTPPRAASN